MDFEIGDPEPALVFFCILLDTVNGSTLRGHIARIEMLCRKRRRACGLLGTSSLPPDFPSFFQSSAQSRRMAFWGAGRGLGQWWEGQLLTNGTGIRWLREVLGYLPVDVKPGEKKQRN